MPNLTDEQRERVQARANAMCRDEGMDPEAMIHGKPVWMLRWGHAVKELGLDRDPAPLDTAAD